MAAGKQKIHMVSKHPSTDYLQKEKCPFTSEGSSHHHLIQVMELITNKVGKADIMTSSTLKCCQKLLKPNQTMRKQSNKLRMWDYWSGLFKKKSMSQITNKKRQGTILNEWWTRQNNQMQCMNLEGLLDWNLVWTRYWVINWAIINFV